MTPRQAWAEALRVGLITERPPLAHLMALSLFMDPPEADPARAKFEVRLSGNNRAYFCNERRMLHKVLLDRKFSRPTPDNAFAWLQKHRERVDELMPYADERVARIILQLEEAYLDPSFPAKPLFEAFCLGQAYAVLEERHAEANKQT